MDTLVVGAGFAGLAAASAVLREEPAADVLIVERADEVGGTWRDDTYPGCACDVPTGLGTRQADASPGALSGGQRQRVAIARALAADPQLLILDEAVAALDVSIQAQILNLLAKIRHNSGTAFLFITHDLAVARHVADDVIVMHRGEIVEQGPIDDVLRTPSDDYTKRLIASVPRPGWKPRRREAVTGGLRW